MTRETTKKSAPRFERKRPGDRRQQLIDAAIICLGEGGISSFTIEQICRRAGISRGLVNHHFGSKDELLACVYEYMTTHAMNSLHDSLRSVDGPGGRRLRALIDGSFAGTIERDAHLRAWLALWGEVPTNKRLQTAQRDRYGAYRRQLETAIRDLAKERGRNVNARRIATTLIALIDGLWLEWCLDPDSLSARESKEACYDLVAAHLGSIKV